ncbi:MAG TPA: GatB/YqeY domain-containing protein [Aggregatilineales bacterium]|nr:GatB/YqeY domain-containing protein [Anaerolineales bacterium]HRE47184.1 GatB/YqeY domain-containing protein [Aggregatilineales bacterium]
MHPKDKLTEDLKVAMKAGDVPRREALRMLTSAIKQIEVDTRKTLTEDELYTLLQKEAKKRRESVAEAEKLGRSDIAEKEQYEVTLIESYLPQQLTREEIEIEVRKAVAEAGVTDAKGMGSVMKILSPRLKGRADGKLVNEVVKAVLNG